MSFGCKERLCLKIWGGGWLRKILDINFGPTSTGVQECSHMFEHSYTHTHAHHICKNTQEILVVIVIWLLSYAPTSEPIIEWGEHSGNSNGKWSSFSLRTLNSEILWRLPPAPSWYRDVSTHIAFIGFDWQVCLVSCTQFQVLNGFCEARFVPLLCTTAVKVSLGPSSSYMDLLWA